MERNELTRLGNRGSIYLSVCPVGLVGGHLPSSIPSKDHGVPDGGMALRAR